MRVFVTASGWIRAPPGVHIIYIIYIIKYQNYHHANIATTRNISICGHAAARSINKKDMPYGGRV